MRVLSLAGISLAFFSFGCSEPLAPVLDAGRPPPDAGGDVGAVDAGGSDAPVGDDAGAPDASVALPPRDPDLEACWPGRFCWLEGADATWIDGADDASVHVVDRSGRVFRRDVSGWTELPGITERRVSRVYVVGRDDVWALATHRDEEGFFVDHFDGSTWSSSRPADGTYLAGYGAEVWTREADTHAFIRHDTSGWHSVPEIDARFAALATHRHLNAYAEPAILPGPDGSAYAITADAVPLVIHLPVRDRPWDPIWQLVGPLAPGEAWLSWSEGEVRVVELGGESTELRFDGRRWVPVRVASPGEYFVATRDGIVIRPTSAFCLLGLTTRTSSHCAGDARLVTRGAVDGSDPVPSLLPEATRPFSPALFHEVAPTYWAGAHAVVGESAASYLRLPREEAFFTGARWLEQVNDGVPSAITIDGSQLAARLLAGNAEGDLYAVDHRWLHGVRTGDGASLAPVTMASGAPFVFDVTAMRATDEGAWAVATNHVLRAEEGRVSVDAELPTTGFEDAIDLVDLHVSDGDVWLLGALGHRTRYAVLFHREVNELGEPSYRRIELGFSFWGRARLERAGDVLVVAANRNGPPALFLLPIDELEGPSLPQPFEAYLRSDPVLPGTYRHHFESAGAWADARGAWLTSDAQTLFFPFE